MSMIKISGSEVVQRLTGTENGSLPEWEVNYTEAGLQDGDVKLGEEVLLSWSCKKDKYMTWMASMQKVGLCTMLGARTIWRQPQGSTLI